MKSNYKKLGQYIRQVDIRNIDLSVEILLGVSVQKIFINSIANTIGTDWKNYKIIKKNQFCYIPDTSRRGDKIGIALLSDHKEALVSQAYTVFEIVDTSLLLPEYLMLWFKRDEFDRYARFKSHGSVREIFDWQEMCDIELPIPSIEKQKQIVEEYQTIEKAIEVMNKKNLNLTEFKKFLLLNVEDDNDDYFYSSFTDLFEISYGKSKHHKTVNGNFPVYSAGGIVGYKDEFEYQPRQIIMGCRGTCGNTYLTYDNSSITHNCLIFNIKNENLYLSKDYLFEIINLLNKNEIITGSVQNQITIDVLANKNLRISDEQNYKLGNSLYIINNYIQMYEKIIRVLLKTKEALVTNIVGV